MKKLGVCVLTTYIIAVLSTSPRAFAEGESKAETAVPSSDQDFKDARKEAADTGHSENVNTILSAIEKLDKTVKASPTSSVPLRTDIANLSNSASYYARFHGTCVKTQATASFLCREQSSPQLQETLNSINTMASMITGVAVKDSCSTFAKIARLGQMGLTAYTAACSAARGSCEAACTNVKSNLDTMVKIMKKGDLSLGCIDAPGSSGCQGISAAAKEVVGISNLVFKDADPNDNEKKSIAIKDRACTYSYANMLVSAGTGIASMIAGIKQGQNCDEESNGTSGSTTAAADLRATCEKAENAKMPECLCLANPRLPGCANALQKAGDSSTSNFSALSSPNAGSGSDKSGSGLDLSGGDSGRDPASDLNRSGDSTGGVGAPAGGGSAGLGGGGGFGGGGAAGAGGSEKKGLNANILGGSSGGGGGGGSWGSGGSSSDSKLRPYLPGGEKDPNKMAGQQNWTKEVTGQGGKSNWEKVRDRYRDNNSSLLNN